MKFISGITIKGTVKDRKLMIPVDSLQEPALDLAIQEAAEAFSYVARQPVHLEVKYTVTRGITAGE